MNAFQWHPRYPEGGDLVALSLTMQDVPLAVHHPELYQ